MSTNNRLVFERSYLVVAFFLVLAFSSCGIYSFTGASIPESAKTITLNYFPNKASQVTPILEQVLNEKLQDKFINETDLEQIDRGGDLEFSGKITSYNVSPVAAGAQDQAGLSRLTISLEASFNNRIDEVEWSQNFSRYAEFQRNVNLQDAEDALIDEITDQLVDDLFNKALIDW